MITQESLEVLQRDGDGMMLYRSSSKYSKGSFKGSGDVRLLLPCKVYESLRVLVAGFEFKADSPKPKILRLCKGEGEKC